MCTSLSEVTHVCLLDLDFTASRSRHGSLLCPNTQAQAICVFPYQIGAQQAFAWWNQLDRPALRHIATKTQELDFQRQLHSPSCADNGSWNSHKRRRRFSTPSLDLSHTRRQDSLVVHQFTWPENLVVNRCCTRLQVPPGFLTSPPRVDEHARSCHAPKHCC